MRHFLTSVFIIVMTVPAAFTASDSGNGLIKHYFRQQADNRTLSQQTRLAALDSLMKYSSDIEQSDILTDKGDILCSTGNFPEGYEAFKSALQSERASQDQSFRLKLKHKAASASHYAFRIENASRYVFDILNEKKTDSLREYDVKAFIILAEIFAEAGNYDMMRTSIQKASDMLEKINSIGNKKADYGCDIAIGYSSLYTLLGDYSKAIEFLDMARRSTNDPHRINLINANAANIFHRTGNYDKAFTLFEQLIKDDSMVTINPQILLNYAYALLDSGKAVDAEKLIETHKSIFDRLSCGTLAPEAYRCMSNIKKSLLKHGEALEWLDEAYTLKDSIYGINNSTASRTVAVRFQKYLDDISADSLQNSPKNRTILILSVSFLIISVLFLVLWYRNKKKSHKKIKDINDSHKKELDLSAEILDERTRELSTMTLRMGQLNDSITAIREATNDSKMSARENMDMIRNKLRESDLQNNVWEMFQTYFDIVNNDFHKILKENCPTLTPSEIRICCFILTGLSAKEIAALTNRSVRTITTITYNLRKKLNITGSTETFLYDLCYQSDKINHS